MKNHISVSISQNSHQGTVKGYLLKVEKEVIVIETEVIAIHFVSKDELIDKIAVILREYEQDQETIRDLKKKGEL